MSKGRWTKGIEAFGTECFFVLILRKKATRTFPKKKLMESLGEPDIRTYFLKLCIEYDFSKDFKYFKRGLLLSIQVVGVTKVSKATGLNRINLYRMLKPSGNPSFQAMVTLCRYLGAHFWVVDDEFMEEREELHRPKAQPKMDSIPEHDEWRMPYGTGKIRGKKRPFK